MDRASPSATDFRNLTGHNSGLSAPQIGAINSAIVRKIKEIYPNDTIKTLATWLRLTWKTAKNRIEEKRQFDLEEIGSFLGSDHGFKVLTAIMEEVSKRPGYSVPDWWVVCEPLMDLADAELLCAAVRKRTTKAIRKREDVADALETEIRRAQALAIHGPGPAREHARALQSYAGAERRVVAAKKRG